jgi:hypothetical protein
MTAVEFARAIDYDYTTIMRWLKRGLAPGAKFVEVSGNFGVWQIPQEALSMTPPRPGWKKEGEKKPAKKKGAREK